MCSVQWAGRVQGGAHVQSASVLSIPVAVFGGLHFALAPVSFVELRLYLCYTRVR